MKPALHTESARTGPSYGWLVQESGKDFEYAFASISPCDIAHGERHRTDRDRPIPWCNRCGYGDLLQLL